MILAGDTTIKNAYDRIRQNFRVGKLSRLCAKYTIHWKTFGRGHHVLYTASDSRGKFSQLAENSRKPQKFCHVAMVSTIKCIFVRDDY